MLDRRRVFPAWMVALIVVRELLVSGLRLAALERGVVMSARDLGKLKTWAQAIAAALGGLAAGGAIERRRRLGRAARRTHPHLGVRARLRPPRPERAPWPAACVASRRDDADRVVELSPGDALAPGVPGRQPDLDDGGRAHERARRLGSAAPTDTLSSPRTRTGASSRSAASSSPPGSTHAELFGPLVANGGARPPARDAAARAPRSSARAGTARRSLVASVGTRNAAGRILLERQGFTARGRPQATFQLQPGRRTARSTSRRTASTVRLADEDDLPAALELYRECFPAGRFPDEAVWRDERRRRHGLRRRAGRRASSPS